MSNKNNIIFHVGHIGSSTVEGDIHNNNIYIGTADVERIKSQLLGVLDKFKQEIEDVHFPQEVREHVRNEVMDEISQAEQEARQNISNTPQIAGRLQRAREALWATGGFAAASTFAADKLPPLLAKIDEAIELIDVLVP